jgi:hypothetical protein
MAGWQPFVPAASCGMGMQAQERVPVARVESFVTAGLLLTLLVVVAQVTTQLIDFGVYDLRLGALDSNRHASVFGVASLLAQGSAAVAAAALSSSQPNGRYWALLALLIGGLLAVRVSTSFSTTPLLPFVGVIFVALWYLSAELPARAARTIRLGLYLLVFSFAVHVFGPKVVSALGDGSSSWPYQLKGVLKHGTELAGWMLVTIGIASTAPQLRRVQPR